jgi:hypothetical protein
MLLSLSVEFIQGMGYLIFDEKVEY